MTLVPAEQLKRLTTDVLLQVGAPADASRCVADHLVEGRHALFVSPRDARGLASVLERIIGDDDLRHRMSLANRAKVADFAPSVVAEHYLEMLGQLTDRV